MLAAGTQIGKYVVLRKLAEGGMAEVYLCAARGPEGFAKEVAIKRIRSALADDPEFVEMFVHEARVASKLNHANVVQIFDFDKHEDSYYLAMEYVRGRSLWDVRRRAKDRMEPIPPLLAAQIGVEVARGLSYAHRLSDNGQPLEIVHRDVTPHNVLISYDGSVKLTDFGIAKASNRLTAAGVLKGKIAYMSPEQARGERVDCRTDVFALGIVVWEMLTGGRLFEGDSDVATLRAVQDSTIAPPRRLNPDVPELLDQAVMRALSRDRSERFQSASELERALAECVLKSAHSLDEVDIGAFLRRLFAQELAEEARTEAQAKPVALPSTLISTPAPAAKGSEPARGPEAGEGIEKTYVKQEQVFATGPVKDGTAFVRPVPPKDPPARAVSPSAPEAVQAKPARRTALIAGLTGLLVVGAVVGIVRPWRSARPASGAGPQATLRASPSAAPGLAPPQATTQAMAGQAKPPGPRGDSSRPPPSIASAHEAQVPGGTSGGAGEPVGASTPNGSAPITDGTLVLKVKPWATVWIDGHRRGNVQGLKRFKLPAGKHEIRLSQKRGVRVVPITIVAGKDVELEHNAFGHN